MLYTQVRAFDAVARAGSFLRAAELLSLSQPALSIQVGALENAYSVRLFDREGRKVSLTRTGQQLYELTRQFMSLEERIDGLLSAGKDLSRGRLSVAFDGPHATMPILARFRETAPGIEVSVTMGNSRIVRQQLFERHVDLAVYPFAGSDPRVHAVPIISHMPVVILGNAHPWWGRREINVHELAGQPMITREAGSNTLKRVDEGLQELGIVPVIALRLGSREAVIEAVAANLGIGIVWAREVQSTARVQAVPLRGSTIHSIDYLACLKDDFNRRPVRAFFAAANSLVDKTLSTASRDADGKKGAAGRTDHPEPQPAAAASRRRAGRAPAPIRSGRSTERDPS